MRNPTLGLILVASVWALSNAGCGDPLADASYRGDPLFAVTGSTEPVPDFTGADFLCSNEEFDCTEACEELLEEFPPEVGEESVAEVSPNEDEPPPNPDAENENPVSEDAMSLAEECFNACFDAYSVCLMENNETAFNEAYYDSQASQRIAILWANPGDAAMSVLQQRTLTATEFPARYTFSVYHPPAAPLLFEHPDGPFAFGLIVSFIDQNRDELLDIREEPIIGFNMVQGILFHTTGATSESGVLLQRGYQTFHIHGDCLSDSLDLDEPIQHEGGGNVIAITGSSPQIFEALPDVDCDGDMKEWSALCETPQNRSRCAQLQGRSSDDGGPIDLYARVCDFCAGRTDVINAESDMSDENDGND